MKEGTRRRPKRSFCALAEPAISMGTNVHTNRDELPSQERIEELFGHRHGENFLIIF